MRVLSNSLIAAVLAIATIFRGVYLFLEAVAWCIKSVGLVLLAAVEKVFHHPLERYEFGDGPRSVSDWLRVLVIWFFLGCIVYVAFWS